MIKNLFLKNGSKAKLLWMLMLGCVLGFSLTSCASKDEGEDSETYETRQYIIGIGKWSTQEVKLPDGTWTSDSRTYGKDFVLEFFDKKSGETAIPSFSSPKVWNHRKNFLSLQTIIWKKM